MPENLTLHFWATAGTAAASQLTSAASGHCPLCRRSAWRKNFGFNPTGSFSDVFQTLPMPLMSPAVIPR